MSYIRRLQVALIHLFGGYTADEMFDAVAHAIERVEYHYEGR